MIKTMYAEEQDPFVFRGSKKAEKIEKRNEEKDFNQ